MSNANQKNKKRNWSEILCRDPEMFEKYERVKTEPVICCDNELIDTIHNFYYHVQKYHPDILDDLG